MPDWLNMLNKNMKTNHNPHTHNSVSRPMKGLAAILAMLTFITNCALLHATETNFWKDRQKTLQQAEIKLASALPVVPNLTNPHIPASTSFSHLTPTQKELPILQSLSPAYGSVRKILAPTTGTSNRIVLHIQDIHLNPEAQTNIAKTLQQLIDDKKVDLVALEGAFGPIDIHTFKEFPHQEAVQKAADYLFTKEGSLSGPMVLINWIITRPTWPLIKNRLLLLKILKTT
jgi:hypothetical protein